MREKKLMLVITFHTTADAMAMEKQCKQQEILGRLAPVPRSVTSDCGIAWCAPVTEREQVERALTGLEYDEIYEVYL